MLTGYDAYLDLRQFFPKYLVNMELFRPVSYLRFAAEFPHGQGYIAVFFIVKTGKILSKLKATVLNRAQMICSMHTTTHKFL